MKKGEETWQHHEHHDSKPNLENSAKLIWNSTNGKESIGNDLETNNQDRYQIIN
jgi:hypothetical protein